MARSSTFYTLQESFPLWKAHAFAFIVYCVLRGSQHVFQIALDFGMTLSAGVKYPFRYGSSCLQRSLPLTVPEIPAANTHSFECWRVFILQDSLKLQTSLLKDKFKSLERMAKTRYCILKIFQVYGRLKWAENGREIWKGFPWEGVIEKLLFEVFAFICDTLRTYAHEVVISYVSFYCMGSFSVHDILLRLLTIWPYQEKLII